VAFAGVVSGEGKTEAGGNPELQMKPRLREVLACGRRTYGVTAEANHTRLVGKRNFAQTCPRAALCERVNLEVRGPVKQKGPRQEKKGAREKAPKVAGKASTFIVIGTPL